MASLRDVILAQQRKFGEFKQDTRVVRCFMKDVDTKYDPRVSGRTGFVWVQEEGTDTIFQAFNPNVTPIAGLKVLVGIPTDSSDSRRIVLGIDWSVYPDDQDNPYSGKVYYESHAENHEWSDAGYGVDAMSVYQRAMVPFRVQVYNDTQIVVLPGKFLHLGSISTFHGKFKDFVANFPTPGKYSRVLVSLDPDTQTLDFQYSAEQAVSDDCTFPSPSSTDIPLAYIILNGSTGVLLESDVSDARPFIQSITPGTDPTEDFSYWEPLAPPSLGTDSDDEFSDGSFDTVLWDEFDQSGILTVSEADQGLIFALSSATQEIGGVYQSMLTGWDWSIITKVCIVGDQSGDTKAGIWFAEDINSNPTTCDHDIFGVYQGGSGMGVQAEYYTNYNTYSSGHTNQVHAPPIGTSYWIRVRLEQTGESTYSYHFDYSTDGMGWMNIGTFTRSFTPAEFGLFVRSNQGANTKVFFPFFRIVTTNNINDIVEGDRISGWRS